jgi:hypothetical protein
VNATWEKKLVIEGDISYIQTNEAHGRMQCRLFFLLLGCCSDTATDSGDAAKYNLTWFAHKKVEHMKGSAGETLDSTK